MKKLILILALVMTAAMFGCSPAEEPATTEEADTAVAETIEESTDELIAEEAVEPEKNEIVEPAEAKATAGLTFASLETLTGMFAWQDFQDGIKLYDLEVGTGDVVQVGDAITAHYTLWTDGGTKLQSSLDTGTPFSTNVGVGGLIKGWDVSVPGMKVGGKRMLIIPGDMAYGPQGRPGSGIKPNATLVFELQILATER
jgi:FKBP-type peptidyl-prolyl cis-trans isomerase FkpA